jgi:hypothetical protein
MSEANDAEGERKSLAQGRRACCGLDFQNRLDG